MRTLLAFAAILVAQSTSTLSGHTGPVLCLAVSPDGTRLASGSEDGKIKLWDLATKKCVRTTYRSDGAVQCLAYSPDGKSLAIGMEEKRAFFYDLVEQEDIKVLDGADGPIRSVAFSPDGTKIYLIAAGDKRLYIWKPGDKGFPEEMEHESEVLGMALSADGKLLATAVGSGMLRLFSTVTPERLHSLDYAGKPSCLAISKDGNWLAAGGDAGVRVWETAGGKPVAGFKPGKWDAKAVAFTPNGSNLIVGAADGRVLVFDARSGAQKASLTGHEKDVSAVTSTPDGKSLASGSLDKTVRLWAMP